MFLGNWGPGAIQAKLLDIWEGHRGWTKCGLRSKGWRVNMQSSWSGSSSPKSLHLGEPAWHVAAGKVWGARDSRPGFYWKEAAMKWSFEANLLDSKEEEQLICGGWGQKEKIEARSRHKWDRWVKSQGSRVCLRWEVTDNRKGLCGVGYLLRWGAQCKVLVTTNQELMRGF